MGRDGGYGVKRAVFLDRDGVLNQNVWNTLTGGYESPLTPEAFKLLPGAIASLQALQAMDYLLFLVSNQPNYAKGKASMDVLDAIHRKFEVMLGDEGVQFQAFYYCFHHPAFTGQCLCRKPSPYFLWKARDAFAVNLPESWMIGDRPSDIACGRAAGTKTLWIYNESVPRPEADHAATDIWSATEFIRHKDCGS